MVEKIRFGIIGCSRIAESSTIPAILNSKQAELVHIGSRKVDKAKIFAKKFDCVKYGSYEEVLEDKDVDAVYISLPIGMHEEWTIKAANFGKHILCEKSSTTSVSSAKKMIQRSKENKVRLMEGFMFRFHPSHNKVQDLIKQGYLGELFAFDARYGFPSIPKSDIRYDKELGGGVLNDAGCYPICASRIIFNNEPENVFCNLQIDKESQVDEKASLLLKYPNDRYASISVGYGLYYQSVYTVWGTNGFLSLSRSYNIPNDMQAVLKVQTDSLTDEIKIESTDHFVLMIESFCKEINNEGSSKFNFEDDLLQQTAVMEAARISNLEKRAVELSELNFKC